VYGYVRPARYILLDADTVLIEPSGGGPLPISFGGIYDFTISRSRLVMVSTASGYTLTWTRQQ
jgi:hypothetical protein